MKAFKKYSKTITADNFLGNKISRQDYESCEFVNCNFIDLSELNFVNCHFKNCNLSNKGKQL